MRIEMFKAMRSEIELRVSSHFTLVGTMIVTTGILLAFLLTREITDEGLDRLRAYAFILVPVIAFLYDVMIAKNVRAIHFVGTYVRDRIEPNYPDLDLWETYGAGPDHGGGQSSSKLRNYGKPDTRILALFTLLTIVPPVVVLWEAGLPWVSLGVAAVLLAIFLRIWNMLDDYMLFYVEPVARAVVAVDVGGTTAQAGVVRSEPLGLAGQPQTSGAVVIAGHPHLIGIAENVVEEAIGQSDDREALIDRFARLIEGRCANAECGGLRIGGAVIAMPGPFDYDLGIAWMDHKFPAIRGVPLGDVLETRLGIRVRFINDAAAFTLGAYWAAPEETRRVIGVTLGTGLGIDFLVDGRPARPDDGVPEGREIFEHAWKGGALEDFVSARGICGAYARLSGNTDVSAAEIAARAGSDEHARVVFTEFGSDLGAGLADAAGEFEPDLVVVGGKIARSHRLFVPAAESAYAKASGGRVPFQAPNEADRLTLLGAGRHGLTALNEQRTVTRADRHDRRAVSVFLDERRARRHVRRTKRAANRIARSYGR
jgi:glucokinase